jgi:hypothetical protein
MPQTSVAGNSSTFLPPSSPETVQPQLPEGPFARHPKDAWTLAQPYPMSRGCVRSLHGLIRAIIPPSPAPQWDTMVDDIELQTRTMLNYMHPMTARGLVVLIRLFDWAPLWRFRSIWPVRLLPADKASSILEDVASSRFTTLQLLFSGVRAVILSGYFDMKTVHDAIGYTPKPFFAERVDLRKRLKAGKPPRPSDLLVTDFQVSKEDQR